MSRVAFLTVVISFHLQAAAIAVQGYGSAYKLCQNDHEAPVCVRRVEQEAEWDSEQNADYECLMKNGRLLSYTRSCWTDCGPPLNKNGNFNAHEGFIVKVSCQASCRFSCEIL